MLGRKRQENFRLATKENPSRDQCRARPATGGLARARRWTPARGTSAAVFGISGVGGQTVEGAGAHTWRWGAEPFRQRRARALNLNHRSKAHWRCIPSTIGGDYKVDAIAAFPHRGHHYYR